MYHNGMWNVIAVTSGKTHIHTRTEEDLTTDKS